MNAIQKAVDRENGFGKEEGAVCNLMDYFDGNPSIKEKVGQAVVSVENVDGILYGCTTLQLKEFLEPEELHELCGYITGQYSDGWGEGFEQRDIQVDDGTLNVHFWQGGRLEFRMQATEGKSLDPGKEGPSRKEKKPRPKMQPACRNGNIFSMLSDAVRLLSQSGLGKEAQEMRERVFQSDGYHEALGIISEYVEITSAGEKRDQKKQKKKKGPCR